jgi:hypothetical protein
MKMLFETHSEELLFLFYYPSQDLEHISGW